MYGSVRGALSDERPYRDRNPLKLALMGVRPHGAHKDTGPGPGIASGPGLRFHQLVTDSVRRGGDVGGARRGGGHWANRGCVCTVTR